MALVVPSDKMLPYREERGGVQIEAVESVAVIFWRQEAFFSKLWYQAGYFSPFSGRAVREFFDNFQPEIVHIQDHYPLSRDVIRAAQNLGIKSVGTNHFIPGNLAGYSKWISNIKPLYNWVGWRWMLEVYNRVDIATAQSKSAAALIRNRGLRAPVFPISCGINLRRFRPDPSIDRRACRERYGVDPDRKVFLFVGRVAGEKNLDVLLRAISLLKRSDIQLAIAGHGTALAGLKILAEKLKLGDRVRFTGMIPDEDLPVLLNSVDIFVMPSEAELLSLATLEAMACGRPVLLANAMALPELVTEGVNGYLFESANPADAARCIELLANQREHWPEMGKASLEKAQFHGLDRTVKQYEMLYEKLLSGARIENLS